jgi:4-hydroxymandelate oxidase
MPSSPSAGAGPGASYAASRELFSLLDYERRAEELMDDAAWSYVAGGVMDEAAVRRNRVAFDALALRPRFLAEAPLPRLETTLLGCPVGRPLMVAPSGLHTIAHPGGELETARGAEQADTLLIVGLRADHPVEEIARATSAPLWLQMTNIGRKEMRRLVARAEAAGCRAIVLTIDTVGEIRSEATTRAGFARTLGTRGLAHFDGVDRVAQTRPVTHGDVSWLRNICRLPLVLKGVMTAEDATAAVELGADAVIVSNHGGRVLDAVPAPIECLEEVAACVGGRAEVYLDSGVRRGSDVLKALALGARAVAIGRPVYWGLAVAGASGVRHVLDTLAAELAHAMQCCGQRSVETVDPRVLHRTAGSG